MKIDKAKHAPGTVLLLEQGGQIHEAVIVGWSPMGQAVILQIGQTQMWLTTAKAHAVEFLKINSWEEYEAQLEEWQRQQAEAEAQKAKEAEEANQAEEVQGEKS